jgi:hypothetical protein
MEYACDAPGNRTWFRIVTEAEAARESREMAHAVEKYFRREWDKAAAAYRPATSVFIEQSIGLADHIRRTMPLFLTLRDMDGTALVTAMLPRPGTTERGLSAIVVGPANADPYPDHADAIEALARHYNLALDRARCYPYRHR